VLGDELGGECCGLGVDVHLTGERIRIGQHGAHVHQFGGQVVEVAGVADLRGHLLRVVTELGPGLRGVPVPVEIQRPFRRTEHGGLVVVQVTLAHFPVVGVSGPGDLAGGDVVGGRRRRVHRQVHLFAGASGVGSGQADRFLDALAELLVGVPAALVTGDPGQQHVADLLGPRLCLVPVRGHLAAGQYGDIGGELGDGVLVGQAAVREVGVVAHRLGVELSGQLAAQQELLGIPSGVRVEVVVDRRLQDLLELGVGSGPADALGEAGDVVFEVGGEVAGAAGTCPESVDRGLGGVDRLVGGPRLGECRPCHGFRCPFTGVGEHLQLCRTTGRG
jgi:hypothetical protein